MAMTKQEVVAMTERAIDRFQGEDGCAQVAILLLAHHFMQNINDGDFLKLEEKLVNKWDTQNQSTKNTNIFEHHSEHYCPVCGLRFRFENQYFNSYFCPECHTQLKKDK